MILLRWGGKEEAFYCDSTDFTPAPEFFPEQEQEKQPAPEDRETGQTIRTPRGTFYVTDMSREQMETAGYGFHHQSEDGSYLVMTNGRQAYAIPALQKIPERTEPEPSLAPDVENYQKLKLQYPDAVVGVKTGDNFLFYGEDAKEAAPALGRKLLTREIEGLGETAVTGSSEAWQAILKKLLDQGLDVVLAEPGETGAGYEIIKERSAEDICAPLCLTR